MVSAKKGKPKQNIEQKNFFFSFPKIAANEGERILTTCQSTEQVINHATATV
jgi:hypothetical protein